MISKIGKEIRYLIFYNIYKKLELKEVYFENIKENSTLILSPHYYWYDFLVVDKIMKSHKKKCPYAIAKYETSKFIGLIGGIKVLRREEIYKIEKEKRGEILKSYRKRLKEKLEKILEKDNLLIFPEGKRSFYHLPIRKGILKLFKEEIENERCKVYFLGFNKNLSLYEGFYIEKNNLEEIIKEANNLIKKFKNY